jgi:hypothetical protein
MLVLIPPGAAGRDKIVPRTPLLLYSLEEVFLLTSSGTLLDDTRHWKNEALR